MVEVVIPDGERDQVGVGVGTELAKSKYAEDVFDSGHSSVWGSWFEPATGRWGYACCRSTARPGPPCCAGGGAPRAGREAGDGAGAPQRAAEQAILAWVRSRLLEWRARLSAGDARLLAEPAFGVPAKLAEVELKVEPLVRRLGGLSSPLDAQVLHMLKRMVDLAQQGDYLAANQVYMDGTIGHTQWHDGFQKAMPAGGGKANKVGRAKFDARNALSDGQQYDYLLSFKRLVALSELLQLHAAPEKESGAPRLVSRGRPR
ncbi:unnamed protein product [Prorocentrum cordatum]|uniref:Prp18 domain-containing protein n=1 Tax=Prorocentrum cordatum TaxID=2364126 RepID=A0ABN9U9U3_9DINO|nr:unnamed protein product [Polarella glacialis]